MQIIFQESLMMITLIWAKLRNKQFIANKDVIEVPVISFYFSPVKIYQRINIRVVTIALEIWTNGDPYERKSLGGPDLGLFNTYRKELKKKIPHDNAQLLR